MLVGLLPILFAWFNFNTKQSQLSSLKEALLDMQQMAFVKEKKQAANMAVRQHYRDADHFYIDKHLETLTFLENEVEGLQKVANNTNFAEDEAVKKRLELLMSANNAFVFSEGVVESCPQFQETTETLVHPVEISTADLQKILAKVEGVEIGSHLPGPNRPQLMVLDFKLNKKSISEKNEVFVLNLKLLKREFL